MNPALKWLVPCIAALGVVAAVGGLLPGSGESRAFVNFRGEAVELSGAGLYRFDTVSSAAQMKANDAVTLVLVVPALLASLALAARAARRGRSGLRAKLVLAGALGFMLYTYITMCVGAAFNELFLVYVALFGLSLFAFVVAAMDIDIAALPDRFDDKLPRKAIAALLFFAAAFLALAWLGRIAAAYAPGTAPKLENATSLFIQAMDLAIVVPTCVLAGLLLLKKRPWGYLLAGVGMTKFFALGTSVSLMAFNMARHGVAVSPVELAVFPAITVANAVLTIALLRSAKPEAAGTAPRP